MIQSGTRPRVVYDLLFAVPQIASDAGTSDKLFALKYSKRSEKYVREKTEMGERGANL
jgi:hypothetical protein